MRSYALWGAPKGGIRRIDGKSILIEFGRHAIWIVALGYAGRAAFENLTRVKSDGLWDSPENWKGSENCDIAATPGDNDLRTSLQSGLNRLYSHHSYKSLAIGDGRFVKFRSRKKWRDSTSSKGIDKSAFVQFAVNRCKLEMPRVLIC
jgi:hypothetical protein